MLKSSKNETSRGGRAYGYAINGFKFDGGPTVITAPFQLDELFTITGRQRKDYFQLVPVHPFFRILHPDGRSFDYTGDPGHLLSQVENWSPGDKEGYRRLMASTQQIYEKGFQEWASQPFLHLSDLLKAAPSLIRLQSYRSLVQYVSRFVKDDFLRQVFSFQPLLVGGNPFDTSSIYALVHHLERQWGVHYALGGTGAIVQALGKLFEELGGKIRLNAEVSEILIEGRKVAGVRLSDGSIHRADLVVSTADVSWTYRYLIPARYRKVYTDARVDRFKYSPSLFVIYFGTRRRYLDSRLAHHNIILGARYKELLEDIFDRKHLAEDFSLYLHMPTITDPSMAPEGGETFCVFTPVPHLGAGVDWTKTARPYRDRIMRFLEENYLPDLQANIVAEHYIDPLHFQNTLNSYRGAAFSIAPVLTQMAWFRPHNRSEEFDNLYFAGAGTHPGAGLPGVLLSARIVEKLVMERL